ncbi:MAG: DUF308 domain-containing protein [Clostridia bacterium]|nr:DUF308 domain-containing protein [Clostridia bacterium]
MRENKFNFSWVQLLWAVAGIALLTASLIVVNVPDGGLVPVAYKPGLAMLIAGVTNLVVYAIKGRHLHGSGWLLADGMCTACLSLFPLFNQMIIPAIIPFFFGVWELFSGILKVIEAKELRGEKISGWRWFLAIGSFELLSGIFSLFKPVDELVGINHVIAIILLVQSSGFLFKIAAYPRLIENNKQGN